MPSITKKNETVHPLPIFKNGVSLQLFQITFTSSVHNKTSATTAGVRSPVVQALEAIQSRVSVEMVMPPQTAGTVVPIAVAALGGDYPSDNYDGTAGNETMAAYLQTLVQAAGTSTGALQSVNVWQTTVTAGWPAVS